MTTPNSSTLLFLLGQQAKQAAFRALADTMHREGYPIHYLPGLDLIGYGDVGTPILNTRLEGLR